MFRNIIFNRSRSSLSSLLEDSKFLHSTKTVTSSNINESVFDYNTKVACEIPNYGVLQIHSVWLRHHCQCEKCYNHKTNQRVEIPSKLPFVSCVTNSSLENDNLIVAWNDGHISKFRKDWLIENAPKPTQSMHFNSPSFLDSLMKIADSTATPTQLNNPLEISIPYKDFMKDGSSGVAHLLSNILHYGFGIINECPVDFEATKKIILKVSHPQNTIYGDFSEWTSNLAHADTAYTSDVVHMHTDTTYFSEPIGLQIFHCLEHKGTGGVNWLVDGFGIAKKVMKEKPLYYKNLASINVPSQYIDVDRHHYYSTDVTFLLDAGTGAIQRIRYNPHDMATLKDLPLEQTAEFYKSLVYLSNQVESNPVHIKLTPGLVIFLDNWRVLHGRAAFTGFRHLCGAYISRSDWLSRARTLKLIK